MFELFLMTHKLNNIKSIFVRKTTERPSIACKRGIIQINETTLFDFLLISLSTPIQIGYKLLKEPEIRCFLLIQKNLSIYIAVDLVVR